MSDNLEPRVSSPCTLWVHDLAHQNAKTQDMRLTRPQLVEILTPRTRPSTTTAQVSTPQSSWHDDRNLGQPTYPENVVGQRGAQSVGNDASSSRESTTLPHGNSRGRASPTISQDSRGTPGSLGHMDGQYASSPGTMRSPNGPRGEWGSPRADSWRSGGSIPAWLERV